MSEVRVDKISPRTESYISVDALSHRNLIINGDMSIAQRGTSATGLGNGDNGYHTCDRWRFAESGSPTYEFTQTQSTDVPTGQGFATSLKMDCTTADTSLATNDMCRIQQRFEGQNVQYLKYGTSSAQSTTVSFWVKSNKTGNYNVSLVNVDQSRIIGNIYTINSADTWEKKTITFAGDTVGAFDNDNNNSFQINWGLLGGTDRIGGDSSSWGANTDNKNVAGQTVNLADSTDNEWLITGVQLEANTVASSFNFEPHDINLQKCLRYFQKSYIRGEYPGATTNFGMVSTARIQNTVSNRPTNVFFRPILRATPTMTIYSLVGTSGSVSDVGTSGGTHARDEAVSISGSVSQQGLPYLISVSGLTAGDGFCFHYTADAEL